MASKLSSLPPSIIDRILGFDDTSYLSMTLWLVGNRKFNKLLTKSVTYVELRNEGEFDLCFLPLYLTNLRCLRHLVIHRVSNHTYLQISDRKRAVSTIQGLSETLETIIFRFCHSTKLFFPEYPNSTPHVSVEKSFPSLKRLQLDTETVWHPSFIPHLPSTLIDLQIVIPLLKSPILELMRVLPTSLLHLTLIVDQAVWNSRSPPIIPLLPSLLQSLVLLHPAGAFTDKFTQEDMAHLPKSLTFVHAFNYILPKGRNAIEATARADAIQSLPVFQWLPETGPSLPPFISGIAVHGINGIQLLPAIQTFPLHLETVAIHKPGMELEPSMIRALPRHLTSLHARFKHFKGLEKDDFPPTLREFNVMRALKHFSASQALMLPPLTSFSSCYAQKLPPKVVNNLPHTITHLNIWIDDIKDLDLPPNLKTLRLIGTRLGSLGVPKPNGKVKKFKKDWSEVPPNVCAFEHLNLASFPKTLTWLSISEFVIPVSVLQHLPPCMTYLSLTRIFGDSLFDPSDTEMLARIKCLSGTENYDPSPSNGKPHATTADFMPRSLTHLHLFGTLDAPIESWSRLPPSLTFLSLQPLETFDKSIMQYLPLKHMRNLDIHLPGFDDDDVALLPLFLRRIALHSPPESITFTDRSIKHAVLFDGVENVTWRRNFVPTYSKLRFLLDEDNLKLLKEHYSNDSPK